MGFEGEKVDGFHIGVPVDWAIPGAGAVPTTRNKGGKEGEVPVIPLNLTELGTLGADLPGALFRAEGARDGGTAGVAVCFFDTGSTFTIQALEAVLRSTSPQVVIATEGVAGHDALHVRNRVPSDGADTGRVVTAEYWLPVNLQPTQVCLVQVWRQGATTEEEVIRAAESMICNFAYIAPAVWSPMIRPITMQRLKAPERPPVERPYWRPDSADFRLGGWRLGQVFHTAPLGKNTARGLAATAARPRHIAVMGLIFFVWTAAVLVLFGFFHQLILVGMFTFLGFGPAARKGGWGAVRKLTVTLIAFLGVGAVLR